MAALLLSHLDGLAVGGHELLMAVLPHVLLDQHGDVFHELFEGLPGP